MNDTIPGGWLDQAHIEEVCRALRKEQRYYDSLRAGVTRRGLSPGADQELAGRLAIMYRERSARLGVVLALLGGIEHGARVDALPSPEEEAAQEADHLIKRLARNTHPADGAAYVNVEVGITPGGLLRLREALGREPTAHDIAKLREALYDEPATCEACGDVHPNEDHYCAGRV